MGENLNKANQFIQDNMHKVNNTYRPKYHNSPPIGWINDINGFVQLADLYHVYAQYYPYDTEWGPSHWGHWQSPDLINWEWVSVALAPEEEYDNKGIYSGTALVENGAVISLYTGVHSEQSIDVTDIQKKLTVEEIREDKDTFQEQSIAKSIDASNFIKYENNPVISHLDLPEEFNINSFRDPKIIKYQDNFYAAIATMKKTENNEEGYVILFESEDMINWRYIGNILENIGSMIECPDYFILDHHKVLISCVMDYNLEPIQMAKNNYPCLYFIDNHIDNFTEFDYSYYASLDNGLEFYAPQSLKVIDGRRIMIGWLLAFDYHTPLHYLDHKWNGVMTLPRELSINRGKLYQKPVSEIYDHMKLKGKHENIGEGIIEFNLSMSSYIKLRKNNINTKLTMKILSDLDNQEYYTIDYIPAENDELPYILTDRSKLGYHLLEKNDQGVSNDIATNKFIYNMESLELEIFIDQCTVEIFLNNGEFVMTSWAFSKSMENNIVVAGLDEENDFIEFYDFYERGES